MSKRFEVIKEEHISGGTLKIIVDRETGVHYLVGGGLGVSGMTPLLDKDGKIVVKE